MQCNKSGHNGIERTHLGMQCNKSGHVVLKGVNWVHSDKISSNGLERSHLVTKCN